MTSADPVFVATLPAGSCSCCVRDLRVGEHRILITDTSDRHRNVLCNTCWEMIMRAALWGTFHGIAGLG